MRKGNALALGVFAAVILLLLLAFLAGCAPLASGVRDGISGEPISPDTESGSPWYTIGTIVGTAIAAVGGTLIAKSKIKGIGKTT